MKDKHSHSIIVIPFRLSNILFIIMIKATVKTSFFHLFKDLVIASDIAAVSPAFNFSVCKILLMGHSLKV